MPAALARGPRGAGTRRAARVWPPLGPAVIIARVPHRRHGSGIVPIEEALEEIRAGRMIILMDDEDRENEGDLCVAAERVTPEHINFMATHGRGLICLSLTEHQCEQLGLPMMVRENRAPLGTAFTVSIDARHGIGRGISAADRATTIRTAIRADATPGRHRHARATSSRCARGAAACWCAPGRPRAPSTWRGSPASRPAGVICEIMRDDGSMARPARPRGASPAGTASRSPPSPT